MRFTFFLTLLSLSVFAFSCETDLVTGDDTVSSTSSNTDNVDDALAQNALELVNALRIEGCTCGGQFFPSVDPVRLQANIQAAAVAHSADQAARQDMDHVGSDGSRVGDRVTRAGFDWRSVGENIAWNQRSVSQVVNAWKNSEGHCKNMMNPDYKYMGFAVEDWYWTQVFAR